MLSRGGCIPPCALTSLRFLGHDGQEFVGKGANVQLGPGMCIARVPVCGRNFEVRAEPVRSGCLAYVAARTQYLAGEDPALGYNLAYAAVAGIQSQVCARKAPSYHTVFGRVVPGDPLAWCC